MKTVLITGCSSGFGRNMVDEFLSRGWLVIATMRNAEARQYIFKEYQESRLILKSLDLLNADEREQVVEWVHMHGQLDALVNNAGYGLFGSLEDLNEAQMRHQMEVNFFGAAFLTRSLLPYLRQTQGSVIFISSTFGYLGFPLTSAYCASKFALEGLAESLYYELQPHNVRVSIIEPGVSRSNFGTNIQWGIGSYEPYKIQTHNYHCLRTKLKENSRNMAPVVAQCVAALAEGSDRRFRVPVGQDGAFARYLSHFVPEGLRHTILNRLYQKIFLNQKNL